MSKENETLEEPGRQRVPALLVLGVFLRLGLTSFGGPIAHLGHFRRELVVQRGWLSHEAFDELVALCQFLPGPASSQAGFAIGLRKAGLAGGLAAFAGFTLPSALLMLGAAYVVSHAAPDLSRPAHGFKLVAVSVVAHAVISMGRTQTRRLSGLIAAAAALIAMLAAPSAASAPLVIFLSGLAGAVLGRRAERETTTRPPGGARAASGACFLAFLVLLAGLPVLAQLDPSPAMAIADGFYRTGALVFGGGHAVLPLLSAVTASEPPHDVFLAGYGLAQAMPGPLFAFAAYLGALAGPRAPDWMMGVLGVVAIFLPGLLLVAGAYPWWTRLRAWPAAAGAARFASAAVVGVLAAAWWNPVALTGIRSLPDAMIALAGLAALFFPRIPVLLVVAGLAGAGMLGG